MVRVCRLLTTKRLLSVLDCRFIQLLDSFWFHSVPLLFLYLIRICVRVVHSLISDVVSPLTGKVWIKQMLLSSFILPALVCGMAFFINFIAIGYHASRAIPFATMVSITGLCLTLNRFCADIKICRSKGKHYYVYYFMPDGWFLLTGGRRIHLSLCHHAAESSRHRFGTQPRRPA